MHGQLKNAVPGQDKHHTDKDTEGYAQDNEEAAKGNELINHEKEKHGPESVDIKDEMFDHNVEVLLTQLSAAADSVRSALKKEL
ncbi:uncharacterized protein LAESUDRAFT_765563 [Laetiporus sulphureus 93-53]|uniref:Uncharacterized protein n=1 Tax=Laetiporus sulphureus 93-53 TaxID=1314785 RepID=A0A165APK5_9APHY|nr:uncharacterized protein LAESUDRAFT_765563 [Laetiporus sulphureus 93-53]KZS99410.1 hypothetical protein LAESUDRAFT_765563 [Laetiporus sulphureus 93-53]